jgi:hypothetical protein
MDCWLIFQPFLRGAHEGRRRVGWWRLKLPHASGGLALMKVRVCVRRRPSAMSVISI